MKQHLTLSLFCLAGMAYGASPAKVAKHAQHAKATDQINVVVSHQTAQKVLSKSFVMPIDAAQALELLQTLKRIDSKLPSYVAADTEFQHIVEKSSTIHIALTFDRIQKTFNLELDSLIFPWTIEEITKLIQMGGFKALEVAVNLVLEKSLKSKEIKILKPIDRKFGVFFNINNKYKISELPAEAPTFKDEKPVVPSAQPVPCLDAVTVTTVVPEPSVEVMIAGGPVNDMKKTVTLPKFTIESSADEVARRITAIQKLIPRGQFAFGLLKPEQIIVAVSYADGTKLKAIAFSLDQPFYSSDAETVMQTLRIQGFKGLEDDIRAQLETYCKENHYMMVPSIDGAGTDIVPQLNK